MYDHAICATDHERELFNAVCPHCYTYETAWARAFASCYRVERMSPVASEFKLASGALGLSE